MVGPTLTEVGGVNAQELEQQAALIAEVTQRFASSLDIRETLRNAITRFMEYLEAEACSIFLLDDETNELVCCECAGPVNIIGLRLDPSQGIVGRSVNTQACQMVRDARRHPQFAAAVDKGTGFETRSILCAPLVVKGKCIGAMELINKSSGDGLFDTQDRHLLIAMASSAALAIYQARTAERLVEQERVHKELELAREIQETLLPQSLDSRFPIAGINIPAREVSGDFYDFMQLPDGRIYFNLADVSGKGMNAAMLMAKTSSLLRCLAKDTSDPGSLLAQVNEEICETSSRGMFVTVVSGYLDPFAESIRFANAGHQPPLLHAPDGTFHEVLAQAPPLGILPGLEFPVTDLSIGDGSVYLYSDGITEQRQTGGQALRLAGLKELIRRHRGHELTVRLRSIIDDVLELDTVLRDDITMVVIEC